MENIGFTLAKQELIHSISVNYKREAEKCYKAKAYLSGCILIGAAMEGLLLVTVNCFDFLIHDVKSAPKVKGKIKKLESWKLHELIKVAKELHWFSSGLSPDEQWNGAKAQIGDYIEVLRQIRNLVHPARYANDMGKKKVTKKYLESCFNILDAAVDQINALLKLSVKEMKKEQKKRSAQPAAAADLAKA